MITLDEALALVAARGDILSDSEPVPLLAALGRRLAADVRADTPWPTTDRSAMDGFAVVAGAAGLAAGATLPVVGESLAGAPHPDRLREGQAIRIMTGAVVPDGADAVVPVEDTSGFEGASVTLGRRVGAGESIRRAGSEVAPGELLLAAGTRIRAAEVGALAVLGIDPVTVRCRPRVAILSTGNEVVDIRSQPEPHQVRDSNAQSLAALVMENGGEPLLLGIARDEASDLRERIGRGLEQADVFLSIGGVSKGTHDLVHGTLAELGVQQVFHGVALKPGKPTFFGERHGSGRTVYAFGLPGNPASSFTVFDLLVAPLVRRLAGAPAAPPDAPACRARLAGAPFRKNRRLQAVPADLHLGEDGAVRALLTPPRPSGDPFGLLPAAAYALIPPETAPGSLDSAPVVPYSDGPDRR